MEITLDRLMDIAETCRSGEVAQWIADQGFDQVIDPRSDPGRPITLEQAVIDLLADGVSAGRMQGISVFEGRVRRIFEEMLQRYAELHADELIEMILERRDELRDGDDGPRPARNHGSCPGIHP